MAGFGRPLVSVLLVAAIIRAAALGIGWHALRDDPDAYTAIAQTLARTGTFGITGGDGSPSVTAFRPPLYPAILAALSLAIIAVGDVFEDPLAAENSAGLRGGVALLHWGLGLATAAATFLAARRLLALDVHSATARWADSPRRDRAAWLAALLVIIDPILLQSSTRVMTETLATALAALALLFWVLLVERLSQSLPAQTAASAVVSRRFLPSALALGVVLALAYLCRPTFIVWTLLLAGYLAAWSLRARQLRPLAAAMTLLLVTAVLLGGWTARNYHHFGKPIWATTHGGYTLLLGNNPSFYRYLRSGRIGIAWDPQAFFQAWEARTLSDPREPEFWQPAAPVAPDIRRPDAQWQHERPTVGDEVAEDRLAYETAIETIRRDPGGFVHASLWRVGRLFSPLPQRSGGPPGVAIIAVTTFYCGVLAMVISGGLKLGRRLLQPRWAAALALLLALIAVHAVYWTNMRMRAPAVPVLAIVASAAILRRADHLAAAAPAHDAA